MRNEEPAQDGVAGEDGAPFWTAWRGGVSTDRLASWTSLCCEDAEVGEKTEKPVCCCGCCSCCCCVEEEILFVYLVEGVGLCGLWVCGCATGLCRGAAKSLQKQWIRKEGKNSEDFLVERKAKVCAKAILEARRDQVVTTVSEEGQKSSHEFASVVEEPGPRSWHNFVLGNNPRDKMILENFCLLNM